MGMTKLTLSAPEEVIKHAKRIAARNKTSVSAMFTRLFSAMAQADADHDISLGPTTLQATGIANLPTERTDRQLLEEALEGKYLRSR
jgi:hypothetical protein